MSNRSEGGQPDQVQGNEPVRNPPGWYKDPSGQYSHEAYWDGTKWTGETRRPKPWYLSPPAIIIGVVVFLGLVVSSGAEAVIFVFMLAIAFGSGFAAQYIASSRGRTETWFFWLGFFLPVIGIAVAFGTPAVEETKPALSTPSPHAAKSSLTAQLSELSDLHGRGALNDEEFEVAKRKLLDT